MAPDFNAELRREEALRQEEGIPADVRRTIWARIEQTLEHRQGRGRRARAYWLAGAAAAIAAGFVLVVALRPPRLGEFQVAHESKDLTAHVRSGVVEIERGSATLFEPRTGVTLETVGPVALRGEPSGVRVLRGQMKITVLHRTPSASPAIILVSHGAIEVMGTAFTVVQGPSGGSVALREGSIRFRSGADVVVNLRPGEELAWPLLGSRPSPATFAPPSASAPLLAVPAVGSASAAARPPPSAPTPGVPSAAKPAASSSSTEELLDRVESLRSRHQFEAAAGELWRGIPTQPRAMRERLSFELGSLLTHQIGDARRACAHWAWHERSFRGGVYRDEVTRSRSSLKCASEPGTP